MTTVSFQSLQSPSVLKEYQQTKPEMHTFAQNTIKEHCYEDEFED